MAPEQVIEIYEKYHNPEEILSMTVIEKEIKRCTDLKS